MKKSYLKEFQVDIGWVVLIFSFKLEVFWRYGSKTNDFPWKLDIFGMKTPVGSLFHRKTSDFIKIYNISWRWLKRDCITVEKLVFFMIFVENLIFLSFYQKSGYCMKIDNFLWRYTNRYCITVRNWYLPQIDQTGASYLLKKVILLKSMIFQWKTLNGTELQWKNEIFYWKLDISSDFSKISKFPVIW